MQTKLATGHLNECGTSYTNLLLFSAIDIPHQICTYIQISQTSGCDGTRVALHILGLWEVYL